MTQQPMDKAVILARGLGTRMRHDDGGAPLTAEQAAIAQTGVKAMIPIGRPFLDYVLSTLADAGCRRVCLVIGPEHGAVRDYYGGLTLERLSLEFAIQHEPRGTADAVLAAEAFAAGEPFLVLNSDNYYPPETFRALRELDGPGLAGFDRKTMLAQSNIPSDRIERYAVVQTDARGDMTRIVEKPDPETLAALPEPVCISMNLWRFDARIFTACRAIGLSPRGELELPLAVQYAIDRLGVRFRVISFHAPVLDMSCRGDIPSVAARLEGMVVRL